MDHNGPENLDKTRCLVTGANGFVGSHLTDALLARGAVVRALVRKTSNLRWLEGKGAELVCGELRDPESLPPALEGIEYVFHVAGVVRAMDRDAYFRVNSGGTASLLEACCRAGTRPRVVLVSSLAAGGPSRRGPAVAEDDPAHPVSFYGESKLDAERVAAEYFDRLPIAIVRPPVIYGPRDTDMFQVIRAAANWRIAALAGGPSMPLSVAHVHDVAHSLICAAQSGSSAGQTFYMAGPKPVTTGELIDAVEQAVGHRVIRIRVPSPVVRIIGHLTELQSAVTKKPGLLNNDKVREMLAGGWVCSIEKARRMLGFEPKVGIVEGMKATVEWCRREGWIR
ncbi:MAG: NAD-dependent epimerase/dehydratase family protein [Planctomycetes bacterium]|nr:NAD-dependent epimerase/dehydratase family protein [Planctomycetota bacterium]